MLGVLFVAACPYPIFPLAAPTVGAARLSAQIPRAMEQIKQNGMIWVSWPKKSSGVVSDVSEETIRAVALPLGLVNVKVCAVDAVWSGLKLVIRKENRRFRAYIGDLPDEKSIFS